MTEKKLKEMHQGIRDYMKLSDEDKLNWLHDCLLFNHFAFTEEEKKIRAIIHHQLFNRKVDITP